MVWARNVNTLYLMNSRLCPDEVNVAFNTAGELWHKRLCHMSTKGMKRLADDNLIPRKDAPTAWPVNRTGPPSDQEHRRDIVHHWSWCIPTCVRLIRSHMPERNTS